MFNPANWYWTKDDGTTVFSSERMSVVPSNDAGYLTHLELVGGTSRWPVDANGQQTTASMQDALAPYNLDASLVNYAARKRWEKEIGGIVVSGVAVATDDRSKQMIMGARIAAEADANFTTPWVAADGTVVELTAAEVIGVSNAVLAHVQNCFTTFASVKADVESDTITTRAQVDAAFA